MNREPCSFKVFLPGRHFCFSISDSGISITGVCALGAGTVGKGDDAYKVDFIGRYASASQIWELRIKGYTEIADGAYKAYKNRQDERKSFSDVSYAND